MSITSNTVPPIAKVDVKLGNLPAHISSTHNPTKRLPWRIIRQSGCVHSATIMLPDKIYSSMLRNGYSLENAVPRISYAKVIMKLEQLLQGDFFNEYIKRGSIVMISEGDAMADNIFSVKEGTLSLELSKDDYERTGLQGFPVSSGGRKHIKSRYLIEADLRLPSMLRGKKGFDRIVWAAQKVLNQDRNWIFVDLKEPKQNPPILQYHPILRDILPTSELVSDVLIPSTLTDAAGVSVVLSKANLPTEDAQESLYELLEFLDLLKLRSPRVQSTTRVDPFISRYSVPCSQSNEDNQIQDVRILEWKGLISTQWITTLLSELIMQTRKCNIDSASTQQQWLALTVTTHSTASNAGTDGYTIVLQSDSAQEPPQNTAQGINSREDDSIMIDGYVGASVQEPRISAQQHADGQESNTEHGSGVRRFLCAEYINSPTSR
ncbi:hypothetical protein LTR84_001672 [Exophiala bonariae]|uniref:Cyclic nucleotide-binding domain-containing protein n=1 Tax=Exophiala bonariae TaxID=1690606 RepID=A0AAV9NET4_9EURO|nr:hypothetical protein LTR84_001672 [Exophiala bonariae]